MAAIRKKKPTLKTIACMTGLGVTTVSKALKDAPDIKASTRERVKAVAKEIGYRPDRAGLRLRTGKTHVIAIVLDTEEEFTGMSSGFILGANKALLGTPYSLVLGPYSHNDNPMNALRQIVETGAADGVILSSIEINDPRLSYLEEAGMPYITHGRSNMGIEHAYFDFDGMTFGRNAVELLIDLGSERVCFVSPPEPQTLAYLHFIQNGMRQELENQQAVGMAAVELNRNDNIESITNTIYKLLNNKNHPDGFVCTNASTALGVIGGIEKAGLVVGQDINIVAKQSPDNFLKWIGRKVYSIEDDTGGAGFGLATSLIKIIDGEPVSEHQTLAYPKEWGKNVLG